MLIKSDNFGECENETSGLDGEKFSLSMAMIKTGIEALHECADFPDALLVSEIFFRMKKIETTEKIHSLCVHKD